MSTLSRIAATLLLGLCLLPGCDGANQTTSRPAADDPLAAKTPRGEAGADDGDGEAPAAADPAARKTLEGRWLMRLTLVRHGFDFPLAIVDVKEGKARLVEQMDLLEGATLEELSTADGDFHLRAKLEDGDVLDARGTLRDGIVWGNATIDGRSVVWPVRLLPTKIEKLDEVAREETEGRDEFIEATQTDTNEAFDEFVESHSNSPLAMAALQSRLLNTRAEEAPAAEVRSLVERYRKVASAWGERFERDAVLTSAMILAQTGWTPEVARELLAEVRTELGESPGEHWTKVLTDVEQRIDVLEARNALATGNEAARDEARQTLAEAYAKSPTDPSIAYALAVDAEKRDDKDRALRLYAELTALPGLELDLVEHWQREGIEAELPSDRYRELWTELRENDDREAREEFLDEVYLERTFYFQGEGEDPPAKPEGGQTTLVELFTGAQCPGCAMADIAISGAQRKYAGSRLIALRYHQHIPRPDPLANPTSETRFDYYEGRGTPTTVVNGEPTATIGGTSLSEVEQAWRQLQEELEPELDNQTEIEIDLSAVANEETLELHAKVEGLDLSKGKPRLRLAVAEESIAFASGNGVRIQEMVVRWMLPDVDGVAPADGVLALDQSFELPELKQKLVDALDDFERSQNVEFVQKPLDLEKLHIVAFVQDDETKQVLQATAVTVEGNPVFDAPGAAE